VLNRKDISTANRGVELQHRHFSAIAAALRNSKPVNPDWLAQWQATVDEFLIVCRASNSKFNRERFLAACNYQEHWSGPSGREG
jgi:hypothetical protein